MHDSFIKPKDLAIFRNIKIVMITRMMFVCVQRCICVNVCVYDFLNISHM